MKLQLEKVYETSVKPVLVRSIRDFIPPFEILS